jgi:hypothetical protein
MVDIHIQGKASCIAQVTSPMYTDGQTDIKVRAARSQNHGAGVSLADVGSARGVEQECAGWFCSAWACEVQSWSTCRIKTEYRLFLLLANGSAAGAVGVVKLKCYNVMSLTYGKVRCIVNELAVPHLPNTGSISSGACQATLGLHKQATNHGSSISTGCPSSVSSTAYANNNVQQGQDGYIMHLWVRERSRLLSQQLAPTGHRR